LKKKHASTEEISISIQLESTNDVQNSLSIESPFNQLISFPPSLSENKSYSSSENKNIFRNECENHATNFFIEIMEAIPRPTLIRGLLLIMFPKGINNLSIRKITRTPSKDLMFMIGENIHLIHSNISDTIKLQWFKNCYNKLKNARRQHKNDLIVFQFLTKYFQSYSASKIKELI
jgi:hypothetical protein